MSFSEDILYEVDTAFDHYSVVERTYEGRPSRVLFSGTRRAAQSGIGLDDDPDLLFDYNQRFLELANNLYPKQVLVIGGGAYTLPMALATALPNAEVTVVELDPGLQAISEQYFGLRTHDRLQLVFGDGRQFLASTAVHYDMIIIDVFSELTIPRQFLTREFVELAYDHLNPGGCLAMNIIASLQGRNTGLIQSQVAAYCSVFGDCVIYPAAYGLSGWLPQNLVLTAQRAPTQSLTHFVRYAAVPPVDANSDDLRFDADVV